MLLLLVVTAISLMTLDLRGFGPLQTAQDGLRSGLEPLAGGADSAFGPFRRAWRGVRDYNELVSENDRLRQRVDELESDPLREGNAQVQLDDLKAQLAITTATNVERRVARVISGPVANFENNIRIDKGSSSGLQPDMVVITQAGLVGRLVTVTAGQSVVELADSRDFGVGVRPAGAAVPTNFVLRGQGAGEPLRVQGALPAGTLKAGDPVVTSGLDRSAFPPDIVVGTVSRLPEPTTSAGGVVTISGVEVSLAVAPAALSFVTVLLWQPAP
ncbi:MAG: rod shape-determining protein MreC [Acidimicrobiales bacterium]